MGQTDVEVLKAAIQAKHGGTAWFVRKVSIMERFDTGEFWAGIVHVFDLTGGHPKADRVYAWAHRPGGAEARFVALLHSNRVNSPQAAVRSAVQAARTAAASDGADRAAS